MELRKEFIEVVVTPNGSVDWEATRLENCRKLHDYIIQRRAMYDIDPEFGLKDLMAAGILDENRNFTEPFKHLEIFRE